MLGALAGEGMLKAVLTILTMTGLLSAKGGTFFILSAAGNAVFSFFPERYAKVILNLYKNKVNYWLTFCCRQLSGKG
ncbi:hypothetical protein A6K24_16015 [Metabacillus litoralis]|uniref:Uncharacterized protein n=1 Tax=Metabacillus litoralis TaxID=152268 RepID=A0A179T3L7_9BACI|nr:hypothetical protein A6K24_16015 [Metabacillus litoralis]